jgi:hypothetical protein
MTSRNFRGIGFCIDGSFCDSTLECRTGPSSF